MSILLTTILFAFLDRLRGTNGKAVWLYALCFATVITQDYILVPLLVLAFWAGEAPGWSEVLDGALSGREMNPADNNSWQKWFTILEEDVEVALAFRASMWALPVAIVSGFVSLVYIPLVFLSIWIPFVISPYIMRTLVEIEADFYEDRESWEEERSERWKTMEMLRGLMTGLLLSTGVYVL